MDQINRATDWVGAYLEWSSTGSSDYSANVPAADAAAASDFPTAYLEWQDANVPAQTGWRFQNRGPGRRAADVVGSATGFREALLLSVLHTESDCLHVLRHMLEGGASSPGTVRLAFEALKHAHRLLDDERSAWHALSALSGNGRRRASDAWRTGFEADWPHALDHVTADVQALTGKILALQLH